MNRASASCGPTIAELVPPAWQELVAANTACWDFDDLVGFLGMPWPPTVCPVRDKVFAALELTPPSAVRAVILGQDPYHTPGLATGLAFSVPPDRKPPRSLRAIIREVRADIPEIRANGPSLERWARSGVLLLNTALTVESGKPGSNRRLWESFSDALMNGLNGLPGPIAFLLWGESARRVGGRLDKERHVVVTAAHPAARRAARPFRGHAGFAEVNCKLVIRGAQAIDWRLDGPPAPCDTGSRPNVQ